MLENQIDKKMDNDMEAGFSGLPGTRGAFFWGVPGVRIRLFGYLGLYWESPLSTETTEYAS